MFDEQSSEAIPTEERTQFGTLLPRASTVNSEIDKGIQAEGVTKLREWIVQLNACKAQNQQLHAKLEVALEELEDRNNQVAELRDQYHP